MKIFICILFSCCLFCITFANDIESFQNGKLFCFIEWKSFPKSITRLIVGQNTIIK